MKRLPFNRMLVAVVVCLSAVSAYSAIPTGYYKSLNNKSGQALKNAVFELIRPHTTVSYSSLWTYFPRTDAYPNNTSRVWDMYSDEYYYFNGTKSVSGMNKEHALPKSWWGGGTDLETFPSYTDLNHLFPSDARANTAKLNWPLGEVSSVSFDNGVTKTGTPVAGQGGGAGTVFEPDDRYKGDFARTYFYMATCYQDYTWVHTYMLSNTDWKTLNEWSVNLLLKWMRMDPVSDKETKRNDEVYRVQSNRNPFIDLPDLAEYIWGNKQGQTFHTDGGGGSTGEPELITPVQGMELDFGEVALGRDIRYTVYIKGKNLTNDLSVQVYRYDAKMFSINVSSISREVATADDGYPLVITYTPTEVGEHKAKLLISDGGLVGSIGVELKAACRPVPSLSAVKALAAQEVTDSSYVAAWQPATEEVDYYIVNRTVYDKNHNILSSESFNTDGDETEYTFTDYCPSTVHTYTVQSYRLGYTSPESNVITIESSGINGIEADKPWALIPVDGGVLIKCNESLGRAQFFDMSGRLVKEIPDLNNDAIVQLPAGIYFMRVEKSSGAAKVVVRSGY